MFLGREAEFPDSALVTALKNCAHHQELEILKALRFRAHLPYATIKLLEELLRDKDKNVPSAATNVLIASQSSLLETTLNILKGSLHGQDKDSQYAAASVLAR